MKRIQKEKGHTEKRHMASIHGEEAQKVDNYTVMGNTKRGNIERRYKRRGDTRERETSKGKYKQETWKGKSDIKYAEKG